ncbi:MAG TPA: hypothetical protein VJV23_11465 [Candidatus Polarisedimenticolia bacterium]|nr:hypothetical protein [Candidatus Polarisedimenticolia bacterium]
MISRPAAGALLAACAALHPAMTAPASPISNEDVVRLAAAGETDESIVQVIEAASSTAFDLDPEIVVELRRAGVSDKVIEAMRRASSRARAQPPSGPAPALEGALEVAFGPPAPGLPLRPPTIPAAGQDGAAVAFAFYLACATPDHVPEGWLSSPLAAELPRHHMIWFFDEARPVAGAERRLRLELPASRLLPLPAGRHALLAGLASREGAGPWRLLAAAQADLETAAGSASRLTLSLRERRGGSPFAPGYLCAVTSAGPDP